MKAMRFAMWFLPLLVALGCGSGVPPVSSSTSLVPVLFLYVVGQNSQNIFGFQQNTGQAISPITPPSTGTTLQPAAVVVHPSGNFLYAANFGSNDVTMYSRNSTTGVITPLGSIPPAPVGVGPVALATDPKGQFLYVLNQGTPPAVTPAVAPSISAFSIDTVRGLLTEITGSPTVPTPAAFAFSQNSNFLYVANGQAGTVSAFSMASNGTLSPVAGSPFAATGTLSPNIDWVAVDPKGRFVYATDLANSTVVGYSIQSNGALSPLSGSPFALDASNPLGLTMDATGSFLYVADQQTNPFTTNTTGTISAFTIGSSGALTPILGSPFLTGNGTTGSGYVTIDPKNMFLYNTNPANSSITASVINTTTGALTQVAGTPIGVGAKASWISVSMAVNEP
jgi:6-phosphogluconolactonase (cycloisomerase 2 family)